MTLDCVIKNCGRSASATATFFPLCTAHLSEVIQFQKKSASGDLRAELVLSLAPTFSDERGEITNILNSPISHAAVITSKKGSIRANHWHPSPNIQFMYLISGSYEAYSHPVNINLDGALGYELDPKVETLMQIVTAGQIAICPPWLIHAYRFLEDSMFINLNSNSRQASGFGQHTYPIVLLEK